MWFKSTHIHKAHHSLILINHFINPKVAGKGQREVKALLMLYYSCFWRKHSVNGRHAVELFH